MALTKKQTTLLFLLGCMIVLGTLYYFLQRRYVLPKIVWTYWHSDVIPPTIQKMLDHRQRVLQSWTFHVVSSSTLGQYVTDIPDNIHALQESHKSDWIRLALLKKYGGCWLDASIIVNSEPAFNTLYENSVANQTDFTGFYTPRAMVNSDPKTFVESWYMLAPQGSRVIDRCYTEYTKAVSMGFANYRTLIEHSVPRLKVGHILNKENYLMIYACLQVALLTTDSSIVLLNSEETMYRLHEVCYDNTKKDYDSVCIVKKIRDDPSTRDIPYIKLTHAQRNAMKSVDITPYFDV